MGDFALYFCIEWEILKKKRCSRVFCLWQVWPKKFFFYIFLCFWSRLLPIFMMDGGEVVPEQEEKSKQTAINDSNYCVFFFLCICLCVVLGLIVQRSCLYFTCSWLPIIASSSSFLIIILFFLLLISFFYIMGLSLCIAFFLLLLFFFFISFLL